MGTETTPRSLIADAPGGDARRRSRMDTALDWYEARAW